MWRRLLLKYFEWSKAAINRVNQEANSNGGGGGGGSERFVGARKRRPLERALHVLK